MQEIKFAPDLFKLILSGQKTTTVREGSRKYSLVPVRFVTDPPNKRGMVNVAQGFITKVELKQFRHLSGDEAEQEGFKGLPDLVKRLKEIYPDIGLDSEITKVEFKVVGEEI